MIVLYVIIAFFVLKMVWHIAARDDFPWGSIVVAVIFSIVTCIIHFESRPEAVAQRAKEEAARKAALIPHVVREFDGCKVYRWRNSDSDHWHYVTKCPNEITTESAHTVTTRSGKTTTYTTVPEIIKTEVGK